MNSSTSFFVDLCLEGVSYLNGVILRINWVSGTM